PLLLATTLSTPFSTPVISPTFGAIGLIHTIPKPVFPRSSFSLPFSASTPPTITATGAFPPPSPPCDSDVHILNHFHLPISKCSNRACPSLKCPATCSKRSTSQIPVILHPHTFLQ